MRPFHPYERRPGAAIKRSEPIDSAAGIADLVATPGTAVAHEVRGVLQYPAFRRLWIATSLSSLGDWLGFLATTALAADLAGGTRDLSKSSYAIGGVLIFRLLPAVLFGPFAGVLADRFDRRMTMVICDLARFAMFASIPIMVSIDGVPGIPYLLFASFMIESISLFWIPAKEASIPNLLHPHKLEAANQLSLMTTYGSAPIASVIFVGLASLSRILGSTVPFFEANPVDLAFYFNASTFLFSAFTVMRLRDIGKPVRRERTEQEPGNGVFRDVVEGWKFIGQTPLIRGLVIGILGAFAAGGVVIGLGRPFVGLLQGGDAAYGVLFGTVFLGLAVGMGLGPKLLRGFSRRRLFGIAIVGAGITLAIESVLPNLALVLLATGAVGTFAGVAWVTGYTLLGREVEDAIRGRTFAAVQSLVRVDLLIVLAAAPFISGTIGDHALGVGGAKVRFDGVTLTMFAAGLLAAGVGVIAYQNMDDGRMPLWREVVHVLAGPRGGNPYPGVFIAFEGGEGVGKSTQVRLLADALREVGYDVVTTFEPGATTTGKLIRQALLTRDGDGPSPRAEALLYAADRAHHVDSVVRPALARGAVVITDRYADSSLAYQAGGRELSRDEIARLSSYATEDLRPDLTVLLDLPPEAGFDRIGAARDRMEAESIAFHERVRTTFLDLAERAPQAYFIVDASPSPVQVHQRVRAEVLRRLERLGRKSTDRPPVPATS